jgi:hypothetical protein
LTTYADRWTPPPPPDFTLRTGNAQTNNLWDKLQEMAKTEPLVMNAMTIAETNHLSREFVALAIAIIAIEDRQRLREAAAKSLGKVGLQRILHEQKSREHFSVE